MALEWGFVWDIVKWVLERLKYFEPPQDRPEVIIDRIERDRTKDEDYFVIKNIGTKTGLNIELSSLHLQSRESFGIDLNILYEFTKIDNIDPRQEKRMDCNVYVIEKDGRKVLSKSAKTLFFAAPFHKEYSHNDFNLLFEYNDSSNRKYVTHFSMGKSGIVTKGVYLIKNPKLINIMFKHYGIIYSNARNAT